jgi:hypothetical protein
MQINQCVEKGIEVEVALKMQICFDYEIADDFAIVVDEVGSTVVE